MTQQRFLERIIAGYRDILGDSLLGLYLHGSMAFGCYHPAISDADLIAVIGGPITSGQEERLIAFLMDAEADGPAKGIEMSVVEERFCRIFVYPTPYQLHYSRAHRAAAMADMAGFCRRMKGTDPDLAAHFTVIREVGITLWGEPIASMFGAVDPAFYLDSIRRDAADSAETLPADPTYALLNTCRILAYIREGKILSKQGGGEWGLEHLPSFAPVIASAADSYRCGRPFGGERTEAEAMVRALLPEIMSE